MLLEELMACYDVSDILHETVIIILFLMALMPKLKPIRIKLSNYQV